MNHWTKKAKTACRWLFGAENDWRNIYLLLSAIYTVVLILHLVGKDQNTSTPLDAFIIAVMLLAYFKRLRQHRQRT